MASSSTRCCQYISKNICQGRSRNLPSTRVSFRASNEVHIGFGRVNRRSLPIIPILLQSKSSLDRGSESREESDGSRLSRCFLSATLEVKYVSNHVEASPSNPMVTRPGCILHSGGFGRVQVSIHLRRSTILDHDFNSENDHCGQRRRNIRSIHCLLFLSTSSPLTPDLDHIQL